MQKLRVSLKFYLFVSVIIIPVSCFFMYFPKKENICAGKKSEECVILLHGLARTLASMKKLKSFFIANSFMVVNYDYPSTKQPIEKIAENYVDDAVCLCKKNRAKKIHFVTHSLGGIVTLKYLQDHKLPEGSRIVMLSPPSRGSELADYLKDFCVYKWMNGPAGRQLGTGFKSVPNTLQQVEPDLGIITGDVSYNPIFSEILPGPDDGKVSVKRARFPGTDDFMVIHATHTFIMKNKEAMEQALFFIKNGKFQRGIK